VKDIVNRSIRDVACAKLPLLIIGQELELEKRYNERIGRGSWKVFASFRFLLCVFQDLCPLFVKDGELEAALQHVGGGSEILELRETIRQRLLKVMQLLEDESKLDESIIKLRIGEVHKIISELCSKNFPWLLELLNAVKKL
jgi:hypothetical protein